MVHTKRIVFANVAAIVGWLVSVIVVPPTTPVWLWVLAGAASLLLLNVVLSRRARMGLLPELPWPGALRPKDFALLVITVLLLVLGYWVRSWPW